LYDLTSLQKVAVVLTVTLVIAMLASVWAVFARKAIFGRRASAVAALLGYVGAALNAYAISKGHLVPLHIFFMTLYGCVGTAFWLLARKMSRMPVRV